MHTCKICGKETKRLWYCEEHYKCQICGTRENLCHGTYGLHCSDCNDKLIEKAITEFKGDTEFTEAIICPYCGYAFGDSWEYNNDSGDEIECSNCANAFMLEVCFDVTYYTSKLPDKKDQP